MIKACKQCQQNFEITDEDLAFYEKVSPVFNGKKYDIPPPDSCPDCRYQRRLIWRNERNLYRRTCDATGEDIISIFSPDKSAPPVYKQSYWWSDKWDARDYGRDFDFGRSFFEQWSELFHEAPQLSMNNQQSENCEYTNQSQMNKDCYMIFCSNESRDCMHGMWIQFCQNSVDNLYLEKSELCYDVLNGKNCYRCTSSQNVENCSDVHFSKNCIGCKNCFGCVNLRNKEYWFLNTECTKDEYETKVAELHLDTHTGRIQAHNQALPIHLQAVQKFYVGSNTEYFSGDYVMRVKNVFQSFNCRNDENVSYCQDVWRARNCQDMTETVENDFCYSIEGTAISSNAMFCKKSCDLNNAIYCSHCNSSKNLFGCVSLNHGQYCVLNKQYTKEEYEELVPRIIEHMQQTEEWGEHFLGTFSPFAYNETVAHEYFPLMQEQACKYGFQWKEIEDNVSDVDRVIPAKQLPDSIHDIPDDILNWAIQCEETGRLFKVITQELDFYRKMNLPIPHVHPDERHSYRMNQRNPRTLHARTCDKCSKEIQTTYAPDRPEKVYCEECYLEEVY